MFFSPFTIAITSLGEERANLSAFRTFVRFVLVWFCRFPFPLGGSGGIKNEMLKHSQSHTLPCIIKLFNIIFSSGIYPAKWKIGYIKSLYKGDDPNTR